MGSKVFTKRKSALGYVCLSVRGQLTWVLYFVERMKPAALSQAERERERERERDGERQR
jgi:hypothetical protein